MGENNKVQNDGFCVKHFVLRHIKDIFLRATLHSIATHKVKNKDIIAFLQSEIYKLELAQDKNARLLRNLDIFPAENERALKKQSFKNFLLIHILQVVIENFYNYLEKNQQFVEGNLNMTLLLKFFNDQIVEIKSALEENSVRLKSLGE